jgi:transcriptional regulator with PAS, ATPase and Fis domain
METTISTADRGRWVLSSVRMERVPSTETLLDATTTAPATVLHVRSATIDVKRGTDAGRHARIDRPTFVVGTGEGADLRLTDATVSREHLRIILSPSGLHLRDEGSKNGTRIGKLRIADVTISQDTLVEVGSTHLAFRLEKDPLELALSASVCFGDALGVSTAMRHLFAKLEQAAPSDVTVLLEGESGVGKEVLAHALHARSARAKGPFVVVDCGAMPAALIESELFGHERGAFTGAAEARRGLFEEASGGTLFLDEIGELPLELQPKLLRALEEREVRPLGARSPRAVDVRVVAATNRRLAEAAHKGEFRRDLYYRLAVVRLTVPPLRDRPEDIAPLALQFLRAAKKDAAAILPADLGAMLTSYGWPGNVRELRNVIERYAVLGMMDDAGGLLDPRSVPPGENEDLSELPYHEAKRILVESFERRYLPRVLERANGVVARAAELAQVARPSLYRMLERLRIGNVRGDE